MTPMEWTVACGTLAAAISAFIALIAWVGKAVRAPLESAMTSACQQIADESKGRRDADTAMMTTIQQTIGHKLSNTASRVDQLERLRTADVERIVKLETNLTNLEKGQERIEHSLETMKQEEREGRAEIIESLREMSRRELR